MADDILEDAKGDKPRNWLKKNCFHGRLEEYIAYIEGRMYET